MSGSRASEGDPAGPEGSEAQPPAYGPGGVPAADMSPLRARAVQHDVERRLSSVRLQLFLTRWVSLPLLVLALVAMIVGLVLGIGATGPVLGGAVSLAGAVAAFVVWARKQEDYLADLEESRRTLLRDYPTLEAGAPPPTSE